MRARAFSRLRSLSFDRTTRGGATSLLSITCAAADSFSSVCQKSISRWIFMQAERLGVEGFIEQIPDLGRPVVQQHDLEYSRRFFMIASTSLAMPSQSASDISSGHRKP